jgi:hypothetical protein
MRHGRGMPGHGPRRPLLAPWRRICRCGLDAWPCHALLMLQRQAANRPRVRPGWNDPTLNESSAPLLTRGQAARSRQSGRWR